MNESLLTLDQLVIGYPERNLSSPLSLEIPTGVGVGIIGANGSGKSTLVKTLAGLIPPVSGHYQWNPQTLFGYVPQEDQISPLFPLTVRDLLKMGRQGSLSRFKFSSRNFEDAATEVLDEMKIGSLKNSLFRELSRGQRQRVMIARALIGNPSALLLDEPYSTLDDSFRKELWELFSTWKKKRGFSFVIIEHDLNRVINQVDWVILLGPKETLCGPRSTVITQEALSRAYGAKLHLHEENDEIQIHFL